MYSHQLALFSLLERWWCAFRFDFKLSMFLRWENVQKRRRKGLVLIMIGSIHNSGWASFPFQGCNVLLWKKFVSVSKSLENYYGAFACIAWRVPKKKPLLMRRSGLPSDFTLWEHKLCDDWDKRCVTKETTQVREGCIWTHASSCNGSIREVVITTFHTIIWILTASCFFAFCHLPFSFVFCFC